MPRRQNYFRTHRQTGGGALARAVRDALDELELTGLDRVRAEVAEDLADLADGCRAKQDPGRFITTWAKLDKLLAELGSRASVGGGEGGGSESGAAGDDSDPLADVLGSGPSLGDAADAG